MISLVTLSRWLLLIALATTTGCCSVIHDYSGKRQITPGTRLLGPSSKLGPVEAEGTSVFLLWGILPVWRSSGPEVADQAAARRYGEAYDGIVKLEIDSDTRFQDFLASLCTLGFIQTRTFKVRGEVRHLTGGW